MSPNRSMPGPWAVVVLLVGAMLLPRVQADRAALESELSPEAIWKAASLDYARQRLWDDFLDDRDATFPGRTLPSPTLDEYRLFLKSVGLAEPGGTIDMVVFPPLHRGPDADRIQVELDRISGPSVEMLVAVWEGQDHMQPVGQLTVRHDPEGMLICRSERKGKSIWSYWPITPQPILP